ncbi:NACHT and ankyrin domain protein, partial [Colletotrichum incanum]
QRNIYEISSKITAEYFRVSTYSLTLVPIRSKFNHSVISLSSVLPLYYVLPGEEIKLFWDSQTHLLPSPSLLDSLRVFFGLEADDCKIFNHGNIASYEALINFRTCHTDPSRRIMEHQRKDFAKYLSGRKLQEVMNQYSNNFEKCVFSEGHTATKRTLPDLYIFIRDLVFRAEIEALYGEHIFAVCPSLIEDFWAFYDAFPVISRQLPRWLFPSSYRTRDKMKANLHRWKKSISSSPSDVPSDIEKGTSYVHSMIRRHELLGFSDSGIASVLLGYLFVTTANTIPATAWMIFHIVEDRSLCYRLRHELHVETNRGSQLSLKQLQQAPLLNSVYREVLRLHVAGTVGRKAPDHSLDFRNGVKIQPNIPIMSASWLGGLDESFWNTGSTINGIKQHPVEHFWAERFLKYPNDPTSGPIKPLSGGPEGLQSDTGKESSHSDASAKLVLSGLQTHWFPFGGGPGKCPGEMLARNTILVSAFSALRLLDIELTDPSAALNLTSKHRSFPFGDHAFSHSVPIMVSIR